MIQVLGYGANSAAGGADLPLLRRHQILIGFQDPLASPEAMRELADKLRDQMKSGIVVLGGEKDGKANLLVAVFPSDLSKKYRAGDLVKELSKTLGGRGGGKPEMAQAGGGDPAQLDAALARAYELV